MTKDPPLRHAISTPIAKGLHDRVDAIKEKSKLLDQAKTEALRCTTVIENLINGYDEINAVEMLQASQASIIRETEVLTALLLSGSHFTEGFRALQKDYGRNDISAARPETANARILSTDLSKELARPAESERESQPLPESERLALLHSAGQHDSTSADPIQALEERTRAEAVELLGGEAILGRPLRNDEDLVEALIVGLPSKALRSLQDAGYPHKVLEQVIAPRRTLMRRRATEQRLTRAESDAAWRLARVLVLASDVFHGPKAAMAWLTRAKPAFANRTPIDFLETSVGTVHVERLLRQLDWGDVA